MKKIYTSALVAGIMALSGGVSAKEVNKMEAVYQLSSSQCVVYGITDKEIQGRMEKAQAKVFVISGLSGSQLDTLLDKTFAKWLEKKHATNCNMVASVVVGEMVKEGKL